MSAPDLGNYRLVGTLGEGGMARVYVGEHAVLGRRVAVKVLHDEFLADAHTQARFFHEAKALASLRHPGIVDVFDFGRTADGRAYIVMELLRGESLKQQLARDRLPIPDALDLGRQIASAMAAAHEHGVVHRDIKPENVLLVPDPESPGRQRAKVLDFGIAKHAELPASDRLTRVGIVIGTPAYMSPEQCRGDAEVDWRADIYSLGIVLYRMLTGRRPFDTRDPRELIRAHLFMTPPAPTSHDETLPRAVDDIVMRCLHKSPRARFANMKELAAALERVGSRRILRLPLRPPAEPTATRPRVVASAPVARLVELPRRSRGRRWITVAAMVGVVLAVAISGGWMGQTPSAGAVPALEPAVAPSSVDLEIAPQRPIAARERAALVPVRRVRVKGRRSAVVRPPATNGRRAFEKPVL